MLYLMLGVIIELLAMRFLASETAREEGGPTVFWMGLIFFNVIIAAVLAIGYFFFNLSW